MTKFFRISLLLLIPTLFLSCELLNSEDATESTVNGGLEHWALGTWGEASSPEFTIGENKISYWPPGEGNAAIEIYENPIFNDDSVVAFDSEGNVLRVEKATTGRAAVSKPESIVIKRKGETFTVNTLNKGVNYRVPEWLEGLWYNKFGCSRAYDAHYLSDFFLNGLSTFAYDLTADASDLFSLITPNDEGYRGGFKVLEADEDSYVVLMWGAKASKKSTIPDVNLNEGWLGNSWVYVYEKVDERRAFTTVLRTSGESVSWYKGSTEAEYKSYGLDPLTREEINSIIQKSASVQPEILSIPEGVADSRTIDTIEKGALGYLDGNKNNEEAYYANEVDRWEGPSDSTCTLCGAKKTHEKWGSGWYIYKQGI